jgi:GNAT superfamily N-acetyltransferase
MSEDQPKNDLRFVVLSQNPASQYYNAAENEKYLPDYVAVRQKAYTAGGMADYYDCEMGKFDLLTDTLFIVAVDKEDRVIGGRRIVVHEPGSETTLPTENLIDTPIAKMLTHLDTDSMRYAEIGGLCIDPALQGRGYGKALYRRTFELTREIGCDFLVAEVVPDNLKRLIKAATENGAEQIVPRTETRGRGIDRDFRIFLCFKSESELPILSSRDKARGYGQPLTDEWIAQHTSDWKAAAANPRHRYRE